jgi:hypothetical protein
MHELLAAVIPFLREVPEALAAAPDVQVPEALLQAPLEQNDHHLGFPQTGAGGTSVPQIYLQLLCTYKGKGELPPANIFLEKAESIFEGKRRILFKMEELDPGGGWLERGAPFIKTQKGRDFSITKLNQVFESLESEGHNSPHFRSFVEKRDRGYP